VSGDRDVKRRPMDPAKAKAHAAKQEKKRARAEREMQGRPATKRAKAEARKGKERGPKPPFWKRKAVRARLHALRRRWKYTRRGVRRLYNRRYRFTYKRTIKRVPSRDELPALLNARGLRGRGAEIGVKQGKYSDELLSNWDGEELVSIDPWLSADPEEYVDRSNVSQQEFERYYEQTRERLSPYGSRSTIWRMTSVEAAATAPDHSFDFVYIDARHDYESVKEDLEAWCDKVRPGGILAGHDYVDGDLPQGEFYVKSAVDEFFGERGIHVHATEGPSAVEMFPTWIVEVPAEGISPTRTGTQERIPAPTHDGGAVEPADRHSPV
jgi:Methyltransferase domain